MLKGFRDFIMRGNVVDLAVGIVIGAAFTGIVTQFTTDFVNPLIKVFGGGQVNKAGVWTFHNQHFLWADFVNAAINFLIVAAVLYFLVVMPLNRLAERRNRKAPTPAQVSDEVALLMQIRDELVAANQSAGPAVPTQRAPAPAPTPAPEP
jgi:large conductance mechanosensitive channel